MNRVKNEKVVVKYGSLETDSITLNWEALSRKVYSLLYTDSDYIRLPYLIHEAYMMNYKPLIEEFSYNSTEPNLRFADGMFLSVICSEEINLEWEAQKIEATFLGDHIYQVRLNACNSWPVSDVSDGYSEPLNSEIPSLIISGKLDPVTPPEIGLELKNQLKNSQHIIIPTMGHMFSELSKLDCYDNYVVAFFGESESEMDMSCFNEMEPQVFQTTTNIR